MRSVSPALLSLIAAVAPAPVHAQEPDARAASSTIVCESKDDRRRLCAVALDGRALELVRRISRTDCVRGVDWDYDARGVWVDRGCRAQFRVVEPEEPR